VQRYRKIKINGRTHNFHRWAMEQHLGRTLTAAEVVHHKNGDRFDNRLENLEVLSHKEHAVHHKQKHPITKPCGACGREYSPHPTKRVRSRSCSPTCARALISESAKRREASRRQRS
jgi:hypothetical protein